MGTRSTWMNGSARFCGNWRGRRVLSSCGGTSPYEPRVTDRRSDRYVIGTSTMARRALSRAVVVGAIVFAAACGYLTAGMWEDFFEIAPNAALKEQLLTKNKLRRLSGDEARKREDDIASDAPKWFASKAAGAYDVWVPADDSIAPRFTVLIDRATGEM